MKKILAGLVALTLVGSTVLVTMTPAEAQGYRVSRLGLRRVGLGPWGAGGWRSNRQRIGFALLRILAGL